MRTTLLLAAALLSACAAPTDDGLDVMDEAEFTSASEAILDGTVAYRRSVVRITFSNGGSCSGAIIGPNLVATAAHCVVPNVGWAGSGSGLVSARILYRPDSSTQLCLNNSCQEAAAPGAARFAVFAAHWDPSYANTSTPTDLAILMGSGQSFTTFPNTPSGAAVPALRSRDYRRILGASVAMPWWTPGVARGYGATSDTGTTSNVPMEGSLWSTNWQTSTISGTYTASGAAMCMGDSGGPLVFESPGNGLEYIGGIASRVDTISAGVCPEPGDTHYWHRLGSSIGLIDDVLALQGRSRCRRYTDNSLPGNGRYYRCW